MPLGGYRGAGTYSLPSSMTRVKVWMSATVPCENKSLKNQRTDLALTYHWKKTKWQCCHICSVLVNKDYYNKIKGPRDRRRLVKNCQQEKSIKWVNRNYRKVSAQSIQDLKCFWKRWSSWKQLPCRNNINWAWWPVKWNGVRWLSSSGGRRWESYDDIQGGPKISHCN